MATEVSRGELKGSIAEVQFEANGTMNLLCRMDDGTSVTLEGIPDSRVGSLSRVEITYRIETPEMRR